MLISAHQGFAGHRGYKATLRNLRANAFWPTIEDDFKKFISGCLLCIKNAQGKKVPRPFGAQITAERPFEVIHMDFLTMPTSAGGMRYICLVVDDMSRLQKSRASEKNNATDAVCLLMIWIAFHGIPAWLITDGGSHFANSLLRLLVDKLGFDHHIRTAYVSWASGSVERANRSTLEAYRLTLSGRKIPLDMWDTIPHVIDAIVNHEKRPSLLNKSAIGFTQGNEPPTPATFIAYQGASLSEVTTYSFPAASVREHVQQMMQDLDALHRTVLGLTQRRRRAVARARAEAVYLPHFQVGEYVVTAHVSPMQTSSVAAGRSRS